MAWRGKEGKLRGVTKEMEEKSLRLPAGVVGRLVAFVTWVASCSVMAGHHIMSIDGYGKEPARLLGPQGFSISLSYSQVRFQSRNPSGLVLDRLRTSSQDDRRQ